MKDLFNRARYLRIADELAQASAAFDRARFLDLTLTGLRNRELMDRLKQTSVAFHASVPGGFTAQLEVLKKIAGPQENGLIGCWFSDFVGQFGVDHPDEALPALAFLTQFGSAEFAIREFLIRDQSATLKVMQRWVRDPNEHVRRLASEGARPRLPWGKRLQSLVADPTPVFAILHALRDDPSLYVRKSVANHLNDITKDHPGAVLNLVESWDTRSPRTQWIVKQGLRTLIKQAHPQALSRLGVATAPRINAVVFAIHPRSIRLGQRIRLSLTLESTATSAQDLMIDYVVHYVKARGAPRPKVFKWSRIELGPGNTLELHKTQVIRDFTTRKHYPGPHRVEIQINGRRLAESHFEITA